MKSISEELKTLMQTERPFAHKAVITLTNGTELTLTEDELSANGCRITSSTGSSSFPVGYAVSKCLTLAFFNFDGQYENYDFFGATVEVSASVTLSASTETIDLDEYTITEPEQYGTTITIVGYDAMHKADVLYTPGIIFPASIQAIYRDVCEVCGLLPISTLTNGSFVVDEAPQDMSCRQVLGLIAQLAGGNFIADHGAAKIVKYGAYNPNTAHDLSEVINQTASTDDVIITGVRLKGETEDYDAGNSGYMIEFTNPLTRGHEASAANLLSALYVGMRFRPFEQATMSYPIADFADPCTVYVGGAAKRSYINDITYDFRGQTTLKCVADSPVRNGSKSMQGSTAVQELRRIIKQEKTQRQIAEQNLSDRINAAGGLYSTIETTAEGDIYYLHDKPTLAASGVVWKMTDEAFAVSTDGGQTWNAGLTVDGVLLTRLLAATGVDADWITSGKFDVTDGSGNTVFSADKDTGAVYISGDRVYIGERSVTEALSDLSGALTLSLSNETQAIPVNSDGSYSVFPSVSTTVQVFYGGVDVTALSTITYSEFNCAGTYSGRVYTPHSLSAENGYVTFSARYDTGSQILTATRKFNLFKVRAGQKGDDGSSRLYFLTSDAQVIKQTASGTFVPPEVTFSAYYRDGNETARHPYTGVFRVEVTEDGTTWHTVEQPTANKQYTTYTPTEGVVAVRCYLYTSAQFNDVIYALSPGGDDSAVIDDDGAILSAVQDKRIIEGGDLLDTQTSTMVVDVSALTQEQVFKILTNDGKLQGIYMENGKLYINAEYLVSGTIADRKGSVKWDLTNGTFTFDPTKLLDSTNDNAPLNSALIQAKTGSEGITALVNARNKLDYTSGNTEQEKWYNLLNRYKVGNGYIETFHSAVADEGLSETSIVTQHKTAYARANEIYNALPSGYSGSGKWTTFFNYAKEAGDTSTRIKGAYNSAYSKTGTPSQNDWKAVFSAVIDNAEMTTTIRARTKEGKFKTDADFLKNLLANAQKFEAADAEITSQSLTSWNNVFSMVKESNTGVSRIIGAYNAQRGTTGMPTQTQLKTYMFTRIDTAYDKVNVMLTSSNGLTNTFKQTVISATSDSIRLKTDKLSWNATYSSLTENGTMQVENLYTTNKYDKVRAHISYSSLEFQARKDMTPSGTIIDPDYSADQWWTNDAYITGAYEDAASISVRSYNHYNSSSIKGWRPVSEYKSGDDNRINDKQLFMVLDSNHGIVLYTLYGGLSVSSEGVEVDTTHFSAKSIYAHQLNITGTKSRIVDTPDYGKRLLYCYETASPMFGDIGEGIIGEDGRSYVQLDPTFSETVQTAQYQVFLQAYGDGTAHVAERHGSYFVVAGTPGMAYGWEIKAKQADFDQLRMEQDIREDVTDEDFGTENAEYMQKIIADYGSMSADHISEINGGRA